jgi:hypothetical protein
MATASTINPSTAPWRSSPSTARNRKSCSSAVAPESLARQPRPIRGRAGAAQPSDPIECSIDLRKRQRGRRRCRRRHRGTQRRRAEPDASLAWFADQQSNSRLYGLGLGAPETG